MVRKIGVALVAIGYVLTVARFGWRSGSVTPGTTIIRVATVSAAVILMVLPALTQWRRLFGPVADSSSARIVRLGSYAAVCALLPAILDVANYSSRRFQSCGAYWRICNHSDLAQWRRQRLSDAIGGSVMTILFLTACAVWVLWLTAARRPTDSRTSAIAAVGGFGGGVIGYVLAPTGRVLHTSHGWLAALIATALIAVILGVPFVAGLVAARTGHGAAEPRTAAEPATVEARMAQGAMAGLLTGTIGILMITILTLPTMVLLPHSVPLKWANPDPTVPHGTRYELQMSVDDDSGDYWAFIVFGPLLGLGLGVTGAVLAINGTGPERRRRAAWRLRADSQNRFTA